MTNIDTRAKEIANRVASNCAYKPETTAYARVFQGSYLGALLALQSTREKKLEALSDAVKAAYIAGAEAVHDCWMKIDPNGPPDRDPDFGEAASDYAALSDGEREALPVGGEVK